MNLLCPFHLMLNAFAKPYLAAAYTPVGIDVSISEISSPEYISREGQE